jgi:hypothetical protein
VNWGPWPLELHALRQHLELDHGVTTEGLFENPSAKVLDDFHRKERHGAEVGHDHTEL